jgi:hypothetical protein
MSQRSCAALSIGLCLLVVLLRILVGGRVECSRAQAELDRGRPYQAVLHYERAVRWYVPGSPYVSRAADDLWDLGEQARLDGDGELALFAYRGLRGSAYATRSFYQPLAGRISACDEQIATLMAADERAVWPDGSLTDEARRQILLDNLRRNDDPATGWVIVLELGFVAWLLAGVVLAWRWGRPGHTTRTTAALAGVFVLGYGLWILGMALA